MTYSEVWKPIKKYEGFYEVSNKGRVRSLDILLKGNMVELFLQEN